MAYAFALLILAAPLYVWRFSIGGLPTNFLMMANFLVIALGLVMVARGAKFSQWKAQWHETLVQLGKPLLISIGLFILASLISLFAFGVDSEKIAQWVVLYLQPLAIFFLVRYFILQDSTNPETRSKIAEYCRIALYVLVATAGALAIVQYFTLLTLPPAWWGNANEPKRAIAFFAHANAFGLFVTPLLAWLIPHAVQKFRNQKYLYGFVWLIGAVGVLLSLSRGAWLGLALAAGVYVLISANKKMIISFAIAALLLVGIIAAVPNLRYRVLLPFHGEKSSVARLSLWNTGWKMVTDSPILGKGVNGFSDNWDLYNKDLNLEHYNFPHNIFLNFWIDSGLLGLLSMMAILAIAAWRGILRRKNVAAMGMLLFIVAMVSHGLIDIPYLKNDLAFIFWLTLAISF
jgi:O-antigen ligase